VVIYGPEKRQATLLVATAELERGTLEGRLGELDGKHVVVRTPAAAADLRAAEVVVTARDGGPSVLSNHRGKPIEVRGRTKRRSAVKVAAGMGTRVLPGKAPEPPRPLPATPMWSTQPGPKLVGASGAVELAWAPVDRATEYRIAVRDPGGDSIRAMLVAAPSASAMLPLPPGSYQVTVAALDSDGFESPASTALPLAVVKPVFVAPNGLVPGPGAAAPRTAAVGTTVVAPEHYGCSTTGPLLQRLVLAQEGEVDLFCAADDGQRTQTLRINVISLQSRTTPSR
jgi:hypothetical protein